MQFTYDFYFIVLLFGLVELILEYLYSLVIVAVNDEASSNSDTDDVHDCAVCLQPCLHPVQLPCGHIFCFLCVKGTASRSQRCALCRRDIPPGYVFNPHLLDEADLMETPAFEDGFQWFYEGVNGWWQYDPRTSIELEQSYKNEQPWIEVLIAGFLYVIDFKNMVQMRRANPNRRRRIKRDIITIADKKGIAGIKVAPVRQQLGRETGDGTDTPASTSAAAGTTAVMPGGPVRQRRQRAARGSDGSSIPGVSNTTPGDGLQTRAAFLTTNGVPVVAPGGAVRQQRAAHASRDSDGLPVPGGPNTARSDGRQTRTSGRSARQLRSNTSRDIDGSSLPATLDTTQSDGQQARAAPTGMISDGATRQLISNTVHDIGGSSSSLPATLNMTPSDGQQATVVTGMISDGGTRQLRSNTVRDIGGSSSSLPATLNMTPSDGQQAHDPK